ncbi:MAG: plastocyanin/azurin family copper-binding protein [Pseudomonadota bacterium]
MNVLSRLATAAIIAVGLTSPVVAGEEHTVSADLVKYEPFLLYIQPGDTVHFVNMNTHNVETIDVLSPDGQEKVFTEIGENVSLTFDKEGIVVYKCTPHWGMRMGGIIVVGEPENPMAIADEYLRLTEEHPETLPARGLLKKLKVDLEKKGMS